MSSKQQNKAVWAQISDFPGTLFFVFSLSILALDYSWIFISSLSFYFPSMLGAIACCFALLAAAWFYRFKRPEPQFYVLFLGIFFLITLTQGIALLSYCMTSLALPLRDSTYAALDQALGFNWIGFLGFINQSSFASSLLAIAYHSSTFQVIALILLLSFSRRLEDLRQFLQLFFITGLIVIVTAGLFPSIGPYAYYQPAAELFSNFSATSGQWHLEHMMALREGRMGPIDLSKIEGLVSFPSFHTCLAIITIWCTRHIKYVFPVSLVLNILVIISTLPEGGHYLVDIFAGSAITAAAIGGLVYYQKRRQQRAVQGPATDPEHAAERPAMAFGEYHKA